MEEAEFFEELSILTRVLFSCALLIIAGFIFCAAVKLPLPCFDNETVKLAGLSLPMPRPSGFRWRTLTNAFFEYALMWAPSGSRVIALSPGGPFGAYLNVSAALGCFLVFPFVAYRLVRYVEPALYEHEKRALRRWLPYVLVHPYIGVAYGLLVVGPMSMSALSRWGMWVLPSETVYAVEYIVNFLVGVTAMTAALFCLPPLALFSVKVGIITRRDVRRNRHLLYLAVFLLVLVIDNEPFLICETLVTAGLAVLMEIAIRKM